MFSVEIDPNNVNECKDKIQRCRTIALDEIGKHPLQNLSYLSNKERNKVFERIKELYETESNESIIKQFNDLCSEKLFNNKADISTYPVYVNPKRPEEQEIFNKEEEDINKLKEELKINKLINAESE
jgi:hypothetical protein